MLRKNTRKMFEEYSTEDMATELSRRRNEKRMREIENEKREIMEAKEIIQKIPKTVFGDVKSKRDGYTTLMYGRDVKSVIMRSLNYKLEEREKEEELIGNE